VSTARYVKDHIDVLIADLVNNYFASLVALEYTSTIPFTRYNIGLANFSIVQILEIWDSVSILGTMGLFALWDTPFP
jgi:hypothetical protein